jgi:hypothetical protein
MCLVPSLPILLPSNFSLFVALLPLLAPWSWKLLMIFPSSMCPLAMMPRATPGWRADKTWLSDLPKGSNNYRFGWIRDTPIRLQIQRNEPCNLSTTNPLVISRAATRLTSPRRLTLACESKNTSKCTEKQPNHRKQLIQLTSGVPQPKNDILFLTEMN